MTIDLCRHEYLELLNNIAGGLARNPEFIKATIQCNGYSMVGEEIAKILKMLLTELLMKIIIFNKINLSLKIRSVASDNENSGKSANYLLR